ncbi:hypothetical protein WJX73_010710 [Symbiochloris irregularis]|uniref:Secreted protein n=1 Tax=Symbiochloris irregularis TaxID=706552 RepID=A0AAW1NGB0_9CHLO
MGAILSRPLVTTCTTGATVALTAAAVASVTPRAAVELSWALCTSGLYSNAAQDPISWERCLRWTLRRIPPQALSAQQA